MNAATNHQPEDIDVATLRRWMARDEVILIDVREPDEFAAERIPGAILRPLSSFDAATLTRMPGKKVVLYCFIGGRSAKAATRLAATGHTGIFNLDGGLFAWIEAGLATETGQPDAKLAA